MRHLLLLSLVGALALAGCDSADPVSTEPAGPTVAFGTSGVNAAEGSTVTIPVTLSGGNGQPVTVEVLFAGRIAGANRASFGSDFTGFGEDRNGVRVATVTFTGAETETQNVTFQIAADGVIEDAETAEFALQNATGATIVAPRELSLTIGTPPISAARARAIGDVVTVEGIVTRVSGRYILVQDASAGIVVYATNTTPLGLDAASGAIRAGDRVQLTGALSEFSATTGQPGTGLLQIAATSIPAGGYQVLSRGNALPAPQTVTLAQIAAPGDTYESEVVCVRNLRITTTDVVFTAGTGSGFSYSVSDGTGALDLRIGNAIDTGVPGGIVGSKVPTGPFAFVGVIGQFRGTNQLSPFPATDIRANNSCS